MEGLAPALCVNAGLLTLPRMLLLPAGGETQCASVTCGFVGAVWVPRRSRARVFHHLTALRKCFGIPKCRTTGCRPCCEMPAQRLLCCAVFVVAPAPFCFQFNVHPKRREKPLSSLTVLGKINTERGVRLDNLQTSVFLSVGKLVIKGFSSCQHPRSSQYRYGLYSR